MKALLLIDIQNDFMPDGSLPVPDGNAVIPIANQLMPHYAWVVATQDWHPADHHSFASNHPHTEVGDVIQLNGLQQMMWPDHCIQNTHGAEFCATLQTDRIHRVIQKGTDPQIDSYSGFFDNARRKATGLETFLREQNVSEVTLVGVATDYCVKFTALDAIDLGFQTTVVTDGVRGVNLRDGDCDRAFAEMSAAGIELVESGTLTSQ